MNLEKNFAKEVLNKIKEEKIQPKARWTFLLRDYVVWAFGAASLLVGGVAVSLIIFMTKFGNWHMMSDMDDSLLEFVLLSIPYFWFALLLAFVFLVNYNIKHTKKGYKYSLPLIIIVTVGSSVVLGFLFFGIGVSQAIDDVLSEKTSVYSRVINTQMKYWDNPEKGRLAGFVFSRSSDGSYQLVDIRRVEWVIVPVGRVLERPDKIVVGKPVRLIGVARDGNVFEYQKVLVHEGPGRGMMHERIKKRMMKDPRMFEKMQRMEELRSNIEDPGAREEILNIMRKDMMRQK